MRLLSNHFNESRVKIPRKFPAVRGRHDIIIMVIQTNKALGTVLYLGKIKSLFCGLNNGWTGFGVQKLPAKGSADENNLVYFYSSLQKPHRDNAAKRMPDNYSFFIKPDICLYILGLIHVIRLITAWHLGQFNFISLLFKFFGQPRQKISFWIPAFAMQQNKSLNS